MALASTSICPASLFQFDIIEWNGTTNWKGEELVYGALFSSRLRLLLQLSLQDSEQKKKSK